MKKEDLLIKHRNIKGWLICAQTITAIVLTVFYPLIYSFILSLTNAKLRVDNLKFIGLDNYLWVISRNSGFFKALGISVCFSFISPIEPSKKNFNVCIAASKGVLRS